MNHHTTIEKMKAMRLSGMAQTYHNALQNQLYEDYTADQYIALLVEQEWEHRYNRKMQNLIKTARFKAQAHVQNVDFTTRRGLDKNTFQRLASLDFMAKHQNIIMTGPTGTGKSYLAQAIGQQACIQLHKTRYYSTSRLMDDVAVARLQGTYHKLIEQIRKTRLLILDDFGLHPFDQHIRKALMDIIEDRYGQASIIIAAQIPVSAWHQLIGEGTIADAILDRITHNAHRIQLTGDSLRKNNTTTSN